MGSLEQFSSPNKQKMIENNQKKIPEYAKDFKREWLCIRGLNKECGEFINRLDFGGDFGGDLFNSSRANRIKNFIREILKAEERGKIKEISSLVFKECDANNIECLEEQLDYYCDLYVDPDSYEFDQEYYDLFIDRHYPGFKEFFELINLINDKIKKEEPIIIFDSDSDSDSD